MGKSKLALAGLAILFLFFLAVTGATVTAQGTTKSISLDFEWSQPDAAGSDLAGWKLYRGEAAGGPYTYLATINFTGTLADIYTTTQAMTSPIGEEKTWYFVLTAFDQSGNETPFSNEASARIDFKPPSTPTLFKVTIRVVPQ